MTGLRSRLVRRVVAWLRRSRWFPTTAVDRIGDTALLALPVTQRVVVHLPTAPPSLYQLRPWYPALAALDAELPVLVVTRDSRTAAVVRTETSLDCRSAGTPAELDALLAAGDVALALHVNLDPLDFDLLRAGSMLHAYIGHGDSDKEVFSSNQVKAFDRYLVAGPAATERLGRELMLFDARDRCLEIGQPQLDGFAPAPPDPAAPPRVVYAPTWEGAQRSASYSSLLSHGRTLVDALVADGRYRLVYRPHPLTGVDDPRFAAADAELRDVVRTAGHTVDTSPTLADAFAGASVLVTDVSAVTSYWLTTGRPLVVALPPREGAQVPDGLAGAVPTLAVDDAPRVADVVAELLATPPDLADLAAHQLGDTRPGAATAAFVAACRDLVALRDRLRA